VRALWHKAWQYGQHWNEAQTEQEFVRPDLEVLGWAFVVQSKAGDQGRITRGYRDGQAKRTVQVRYT